MNKSHLIDRIAASLGTTRAEASLYLDAVLEGITLGLVEDGRVKISGFGGFTRRHRPERNGTKPTTGEPIRIPASETCGFKAAPALRERLSERAGEGPAQRTTERAGRERPTGQVEAKPPARQSTAR